MGQYYTPIILNEKNEPVKAWHAHHDGNGLKLMEHSWIDNNFVAVVEHELLNNPQRLVWAGDYADEEPDGNSPRLQRIIDSFEYTRHTMYGTYYFSTKFDEWLFYHLPFGIAIRLYNRGIL